MLQGKTVIIGVTGSIAAYKMANAANMLVKLGCDVHVIMTENAGYFINPITFETLTGNRCLTETFDRNFEFHVAHVSLAQKADAVLIAPASANVIAKLAGGIADDMLTTTVLAAGCPKLVAPAMNTRMYENPITRDNLGKLAGYGFELIEPAEGRLACRDTGKGKLPEESLLVEAVVKTIAKEKDLAGKQVLVTAGPTREAIDPVRFISNHSTGKMGYAIARQAMLRGAEVTLISGPVSLPAPYFVNTVAVTTAEEMYQQVMQRSDQQDIIIKAAAVADYRPAEVAAEKVKKEQEQGSLAIPLARTKDILRELGSRKRDGQFLCGFSMETERLIENSKKKLAAKNLDMIAANNLKEEGAGFAGDTNRVTLITGREEIPLPLLSKAETADRMIDEIVRNMDEQQG